MADDEDGLDEEEREAEEISIVRNTPGLMSKDYNSVAGHQALRAMGAKKRKTEETAVDFAAIMSKNMEALKHTGLLSNPTTKADLRETVNKMEKQEEKLQEQVQQYEMLSLAPQDDREQQQERQKRERQQRQQQERRQDLLERDQQMQQMREQQKELQLLREQQKELQLLREQQNQLSPLPQQQQRMGLRLPAQVQVTGQSVGGPSSLLDQVVYNQRTPQQQMGTPQQQMYQANLQRLLTQLGVGTPPQSPPPPVHGLLGGAFFVPATQPGSSS
ncbi:hypothetical protein V8C86DRAFT_3102737 [Haematococcus lacustris]